MGYFLAPFKVAEHDDFFKQINNLPLIHLMWDIPNLGYVSGESFLELTLSTLSSDG